MGRFDVDIELYECLKRIIEPDLPRVSAEDTASTETFASYELRVDGTPQRNVVVRSWLGVC